MPGEAGHCPEEVSNMEPTEPQKPNWRKLALESASNCDVAYLHYVNGMRQATQTETEYKTAVIDAECCKNAWVTECASATLDGMEPAVSIRREAEKAEKEVSRLQTLASGLRTTVQNRADTALQNVRTSVGLVAFEAKRELDAKRAEAIRAVESAQSRLAQIGGGVARTVPAIGPTHTDILNQLERTETHGEPSRVLARIAQALRRVAEMGE